MTRVCGTVVEGHRVASGQAADSPYPAGTIGLQTPHFAARGLDLSGMYPATINVDIAPSVWRPTHPAYTFTDVAWSDLIPAETFSFDPITVTHNGVDYEGWIYRPHPETKPAHRQRPSVVEVLAPFIPDLRYDDRVSLRFGPGVQVVTIRERQDEDLAELERILAEQQPYSGYPHAWPLPFPVVDFLKRETEEAAWVATLEDRLVGHVSVTAVDDSDFARMWADAADRPLNEIACVSVLFVAHDAQGLGAGSALLECATSFIQQSGRTPALDVVDHDGRAAQLYRRRGWVEVDTGRPWWLRADENDVLLMIK